MSSPSFREITMIITTDKNVLTKGQNFKSAKYSTQGNAEVIVADGGDGTECVFPFTSIFLIQHGVPDAL